MTSPQFGHIIKENWCICWFYNNQNTKQNYYDSWK